MELILTLFQIIIFTYLIGGLTASIYSLWAERDWDDKPLFGLKYLNNKVIYSGAFFAILLMLSEGMKTLLFFIPDSWGSVDEYGDWNSAKDHWSMMLSLFITIFLFVYIGKNEQKKREEKEKAKENDSAAIR